MTDRDVLQALLDGKIIVDGSTLHEFRYKLIEDRIHVRFGNHGWGASDHIPELDSDYVKIVEDEE